jgi:hypothetical protein
MPPSAFLLKRLAALMNNAPSQTPPGYRRLGSKVSGRALGTGLQWSGEWWPDEVKELAQKADWSFSVQKKNKATRPPQKHFCVSVPSKA